MKPTVYDPALRFMAVPLPHYLWYIGAFLIICYIIWMCWDARHWCETCGQYFTPGDIGLPDGPFTDISVEDSLTRADSRALRL